MERICLVVNPLCELETDGSLVTRFLNSRLATVFDIGSNKGDFIDRVLVNHSTVHAFEPIPDLAKELKAKYRGNKKVVVNYCAVSDQNGKVDGINVYLCWALLQAPHARAPRALDYVDKPDFTMLTVTLDSYIEWNKAMPAFVKLDVDGYEFKVLKGGRKFLESQCPPIMFEYSYLPELLGDSVEEMCRFIYELGYKAVSMNGRFECPDWQSMWACYPAHTSFDIMLMPQEWKIT